jgi:hypothetical protein
MGALTSTIQWLFMSASSLIQIDQYHQNHLWVITVQEYSHAAVDAWEAAVRGYITHQIGGPERYLVYDFLGVPNLGFTNYMRYRASELAKDNRDATGRVAIVAHLHPLVDHLFRWFIRTTGHQVQPHLEVKLLKDRATAIAWVQQVLPPDVLHI